MCSTQVIQRYDDVKITGEWMFTGPLENHPEIVDSRGGFLLGCPGRVLRQIRDPMLLYTALRDNNFKALETTLEPPSGNGWLSKRLRSCNGESIYARIKRGPGFYYQRFQEGQVHCALYLGDGRGRAVLLGATKQLTNGFKYAGSVFPVKDVPIGMFEYLGMVISKSFSPRGLFGVDCILDDKKRIWPIEVNPRYNGCTEIVEDALGVNAISLHREACFGHLPQSLKPMKCVGKRVVFTKAPTLAPTWSNRVGLADLDAPGTPIGENCPLCTVFAEGEDEFEVQKILESKVNQVLSWVGT